jgi:hypothetical protein
MQTQIPPNGAVGCAERRLIWFTARASRTGRAPAALRCLDESLDPAPGQVLRVAVTVIRPTVTV